MNSQSHHRLDLSIVSPARNEEESIRPFIQHIANGLTSSKITFELIIVDDGSTDRTFQMAMECARLHPWLRTLKIHRDPSDDGCGKSAALQAGIESARGECIAFIDADGQNNCRDLIEMFQLLKKSGCDMVHGDRSGHRRDNWRRRLSSIAATRLRQIIFNDGIRDSACGLQLMTRQMAEALPLQFAGIHRFLPCYGKLAGYTVLQMPVAHHPRIAGKSKYGFGNRVLRSFIDLLALLWMSRRFKVARWKEVRSESEVNCSEGTTASKMTTSTHEAGSKP